MDIKFTDIFHLSEQEIESAKIALNMGWQGRSHFLDWYESDEADRNVDFSYYSHQGNNTEKNLNRNFTSIGQICFGFVRMNENSDNWLLVTVGRIKSIPDAKHPGTCEHEELEEYRCFLGRLVLKYHKGNTFSRYVFNLKSLIDNLVISDILPNVYEPIKFNGFENVNLKFKTLKAMLDGTRYSDYRAALMGVKGVYCLTDTHTGKLYIGSACGKDGILQRWNEYKSTMTGGNKGLIALLNQSDETYFEQFFECTILETFPKSITNEKVLERENYWKDVFKTREFGYNKN